MVIFADLLISVPAAAQPLACCCVGRHFFSARYVPKIVLLGKDRWLRHGVTMLVSLSPRGASLVKSLNWKPASPATVA